MRWFSVVAFAGLASCTRHSVAELQVATTPAVDAENRRATSEIGARLQGGEAARAESAPAITTNDLDRRTAELFGEARRVPSTVPASLVPESPELPAESEPTWDIDVRSYETVDRVRHYVRQFTGSSRDYFVERLARGSRYEPMIRAKLRAGELPEDMYYLALVESGFDPHAYSRAAAVGMWQFMTTTAQGMGLRVDWWVDERRDPIRSTDAAVRFLRGLNEQFGSLYLAAAAYNGGPGRIARGLTRYASELDSSSADDMFFVLAEKKYLRNETREYVPRLIAAALVAKEHDRYGLELEQREPFAYDSVIAPPRMPLATIALAAGTSVRAIQELNPHILRGMTPPGRRDTMFVRIPVGSRARYDSARVALDSSSMLGAKTVVAGKGATWASIARKERVSARAVSTYNPKVKAQKGTGTLVAGTPILVPAPSVVKAALSIPDPSIERYGSGTRTHVVRRGDNLTVIAKRYKTTPAVIMRLNRLKKPMIFPGQELLVRR